MLNGSFIVWIPVMTPFKNILQKQKHIYLKRLCVGGEEQRFAKFSQLRPFELHLHCPLSMNTLRTALQPWCLLSKNHSAFKLFQLNLCGFGENFLLVQAPWYTALLRLKGYNSILPESTKDGTKEKYDKYLKWETNTVVNGQILRWE